VLWGRQEILDSMPPYQGGGEMILNVDFFQDDLQAAPHRFEAGTPDISGAIGLHAALDYLDAIGATTFSSTTRSWPGTPTNNWRG